MRRLVDVRDADRKRLGRRIQAIARVHRHAVDIIVVGIPRMLEVRSGPEPQIAIDDLEQVSVRTIGDAEHRRTADAVDIEGRQMRDEA